MNQFYNGIILSCAFISFSKAQAQQKVSEEILHYFDQKLLFIENNSSIVLKNFEIELKQK